MAELFKDMYNEKFVDNLTTIVGLQYDKFDREGFKKKIFSKGWEQKELKERMRHVSTTIEQFLPDDYQYQLDILIRYLQQSKHAFTSNDSIVMMFIPDFVEVFGMDKYDQSVEAMEEITKYTSCEFAVRPFIVKYGTTMLEQMDKWSLHKDYRVRRLASEGCRPRLPWAMALPELKKDPSPIVPLLDRLKDDPNEWVRRSVANNLNDIAKDNPELLLNLLEKWKGKNKEQDWVVKHGARTLLKQGNTRALRLFGFAAAKDIAIENLSVKTPEVKIGDELQFDFELKNTANTDQLVRLEYGLYYQKANGTLAPKVFKISEKTYGSNSHQKIERKQSFKIITTRKFHPGLHAVSIIVNGEEKTKKDFQLVE